MKTYNFFQSKTFGLIISLAAAATLIFYVINKNQRDYQIEVIGDTCRIYDGHRLVGSFATPEIVIFDNQ